jgi:hypothetical protein
MGDNADKTIQVKLIGEVLAKMIPPAARVANVWAGNLYDAGIRFHPELVDQDEQLSGKPMYQPENHDAVVHQALNTLRQMAKQFPQFRGLVAEIEAAKTPDERAAAAQRLREHIDPQMLAQAEARAGLRPDDHTE